MKYVTFLKMCIHTLQNFCNQKAFIFEQRCCKQHNIYTYSKTINVRLVCIVSKNYNCWKGVTSTNHMEYISPSSHFQSIWVFRSEVGFLVDSIYMGLVCVSIQPVCIFWLEHLIHLHVIIDIYVPTAIFLIVWGLLL